VGGVPGIVRHGQTGFLLDPGDSDGLAAALAELARNPRLRTEMGRRARTYVEENHSLHRLPVYLAGLYEMALPPRPSRASVVQGAPISTTAQS
jgi:hypothetical protein